MFKVGDRVQIKTAAPWGHTRYPNDYFNTFGTITSTDIFLNILCDKDNVIWAFYESEVELIKSADIEESFNKSNELMEFLLS